MTQLRWSDLLERAWARRACFVCGKLGLCAHREPLVDQAEIRAALGSGALVLSSETIQ